MFWLEGSRISRISHWAGKGDDEVEVDVSKGGEEEVMAPAPLTHSSQAVEKGCNFSGRKLRASEARAKNSGKVTIRHIFT